MDIPSIVCKQDQVYIYLNIYILEFYVRCLSVMDMRVQILLLYCYCYRLSGESTQFWQELLLPLRLIRRTSIKIQKFYTLISA